MKKVITILLVLLIGLSCINEMVVIALNYHINKEEITNRYCENLYKPELACQAKCYLQKQFDAASDAEDGLPITSEFKPIFDDQLFVTELPTKYTFYTNILVVILPNMLHSDYITSVFHPPSLA